MKVFLTIAFIIVVGGHIAFRVYNYYNEHIKGYGDKNIKQIPSKQATKK